MKELVKVAQGPKQHKRNFLSSWVNFCLFFASSGASYYGESFRAYLDLKFFSAWCFTFILDSRQPRIAHEIGLQLAAETIPASFQTVKNKILLWLRKKKLQRVKSRKFLLWFPPRVPISSKSFKNLSETEFFFIICPVTSHLYYYTLTE